MQDILVEAVLRGEHDQATVVVARGLDPGDLPGPFYRGRIVARPEPPDRVRGVGPHHIEAPGDDDPPMVQDGHAVADLLHLRHVVAAQDDGHAAGGQAAQCGPQVADPRGVHPVGRLVQDQQARTAEHGAGQAQALAHPERVTAHLLAAGIGQADALERPVNQVGGVPAVEPGQHSQVLPAAEVRVEAGRLDEPAHPVEPARARLGPGAPEQPQSPLVREDKAEESREEGALAGAVGTEQAVDGAIQDSEIHLVEGGGLTEPLRHPAGFHGQSHFHHGDHRKGCARPLREQTGASR